MAATPKITVRMYNVGFGDAFLVTVHQDPKPWRMLIDCGVHTRGSAPAISEVVAAIIDDLVEGGESPHLDVVVATHHHADHIVGFAEPAWDAVTVDEVWLPWVENDHDEQAKALQRDFAVVAAQLTSAAKLRLDATESASRRSTLSTALALAINSTRVQAATDRLHGRTSGFVTPENVKYLPDAAASTTEVTTKLTAGRVHVLGPSRDERLLRRMNPPKSAEWFQLDSYGDSKVGGQLFDERFSTDLKTLKANPRCRALLNPTKPLAKLDFLDDDAILVGASRLERWCNNTSLFLVLQVGDRRLVFPGDSQEGAWDHVLSTPENRALIADADLYKISHHGSHNGTPRQVVDDILGDGHLALLPYGKVEQWTKIPKQTLLDALTKNRHRILRSDAPEAHRPSRIRVHPDDLWSEVSL